MDPSCVSLWITVLDPAGPQSLIETLGGSWLIKVVDPAEIRFWLFVDPVQSQLWILVDPSNGS